MTLISSGFSIFVACSAIPLGKEAKLSGYCVEVTDAAAGEIIGGVAISALVCNLRKKRLKNLVKVNVLREVHGSRTAQNHGPVLYLC